MIVVAALMEYQAHNIVNATQSIRSKISRVPQAMTSRLKCRMKRHQQPVRLKLEDVQLLIGTGMLKQVRLLDLSLFITDQ